MEPLVTLPVCLKINQQSGSGARSLIHLNIYLRNFKLVKVLKLSILYFSRKLQWWERIGFLFIICIVWLYSDLMHFVNESATSPWCHAVWYTDDHPNNRGLKTVDFYRSFVGLYKSLPKLSTFEESPSITVLA